MTTIIFLVIGFLIGFLVRPLLSFHKHDWEVLCHSDINVDGLEKIPVAYEKSASEILLNLKLERDEIFVTYKKCKKCKQCNITFTSNKGNANREYMFDFDVVKAQLDAHIQKQKEKEDQALIESVNSRIGLTSPEVPYNPIHAKQTTPQ